MKGARNLLADPLRSTRHQDNLVREVEGVAHDNLRKPEGAASALARILRALTI